MFGLFGKDPEIKLPSGPTIIDGNLNPGGINLGGGTTPPKIDITTPPKLPTIDTNKPVEKPSTPSLGGSMGLDKDGNVVEGDITTDSNVHLPSGTTGGDNSPHGGPIVIGGVGGKDGNGGTSGNESGSSSSSSSSSSSGNSYTPPTNVVTPSKPASKPEPEPEPEPEPIVAPTPEYNITADDFTYLTKDDIKDTFTYQERKELGMDKNSTEVILNPDGTYSVRTSKGDIYVIKGEGEGREITKTADWRDFDGDGNVSFAEHLATMPAKMIYKGQDLSDATYDLFDDPDDYWKDLKDRVNNTWENTKESTYMATGGGDKFGLTKYGVKADLNGDGKIDFGERFSNTVDNIITGYNDIGVDNLKNILDFTLTSFGVSSKDSYRITKGAETVLGYVNAALQTVWNPIGGMGHFISAAADAAKDPKYKNAVGKQNNMEQQLYGENVTNPQPTTSHVNVELPSEIEQVMNQVAARLKKASVIDSDKLVMEGRERHKLEEANNSKELKDINKMEELDVQAAEDEEARIIETKKTIKKAEEEDLPELKKVIEDLERQIANLGKDTGSDIKGVFDGSKFGLKGQVDKWLGKDGKEDLSGVKAELEEQLNKAKETYEKSKGEIDEMKKQISDSYI